MPNDRRAIQDDRYKDPDVMEVAQLAQFEIGVASRDIGHGLFDKSIDFVRTNRIRVERNFTAYLYGGTQVFRVQVSLQRIDMTPRKEA